MRSLPFSESDSHHIDTLAMRLVRAHLPEVTEDDKLEQINADELAKQIKKTVEFFVKEKR